MSAGTNTAPFVKGSCTSQQASQVIQPSAGVLRVQVAQYIAQTGGAGATDDEVQVALDMNPSTERPRRVELVELGQVKDSGLRRQTRSGRQAVVWVFVPPAAQQLQRQQVQERAQKLRELMDLVETWTVEELGFLLDSARQKTLGQPSLEELDAVRDALDDLDG